MTDSACRAAACHNRRRRGFLQARPPQGACSQRVFLGARRNRPRPRHMPCSLQIGGRLLWKGRTHFQKCTAGCLAGGRRTDSFTGRLHWRGPSCLFPPKQKRLPRGQNQSRTAGVCLLLSASAAAHEGGNRLSARWKKAIPAQTETAVRKRAVLDHYGVKDIDRPKTARLYKAKYPFMTNWTLPKAAQLYEKTHACNRQTLPGGRRSFTKKAPTCSRQALPERAQLREKIPACCRHPLPEQRGLAGKFSPCIRAHPAARQKAALLLRCCQGCSSPAANHFCLPRQVKASSALLSTPPSHGAAAALLLPPRPRSISCRKEGSRKPKACGPF